MGPRDKLKRLQKIADGELTTLVCQKCGEELRVAQDTDLDLLAFRWAQEQNSSETYQPTPPDVFRVLEHEHGQLVEKRSGRPWPLMDIGGGQVGLTR